MARQTYGQTWWGEQWLKALTHIDYDNRLPRGRAYASKGAVRSLEIRDGVISAKVQGSRPRPYEVRVTVPPVSGKDAKRLLDALAASPVVIARMLNRELDPAVLDQAKQLGIAVFPEKWKDLDMHCSCPDWAVPCKHLAAAIYLVSREIDGNPFLVFSLRGIDLTAALKERNIAIEREAKAALPMVKDMLALRAGAEGQPDEVSTADASSALDALDFSSLPNLSDTLVRVLPEKPAFYPHGDFRLLYGKTLKRISRAARQELELVPNGHGKYSAPNDETRHPHFPLPRPLLQAGKVDKDSLREFHLTQESGQRFHASDAPLIQFDAGYAHIVSGTEDMADWNVILHTLSQTNAADLPDFQPQVAALYHVRLATLHLLAQGAIFPQLFAIDGGHVGLRWLPATLDGAVQSLIIRLSQGLPAGLAVLKQGRKQSPLTPQAQAEALCSLALGHYIHQWNGLATSDGNKITHLFFTTGRAVFDGPGEGSIAAGIQVWLSRFHLSQHNHAPVLWLEEANTANDFALSLAVENRETPLEKPVPLDKVLTGKRWEAERFGVLQTVSLLSGFFPPLNGYVSSGAKQPLPMSAPELPAFLFDTLPVIRLLGIRALLPKGLDHLLRPRLSMQMSAKARDSSSFLDINDLFAFDWKIALGNSLLTRAEFEKLVKSASGIIRFKSEYVYLDPEEIERLRTQLQKPPSLSGAELLRIALAEEYAGTPIVLDKAMRQVIRELTDIGEVPLPHHLNATLRPYQQRGYAWLYRNHHAGFGSVIADDMGLGKTLQVIVTLLKLKEEGALKDAGALVVVPTTLLTNWQKEIARFAPTLTAAIYHGTKRELEQARPDVLLTTYGVVRADQAALKKMSWRMVIADEAQNIKNPAAAQAKAIKAIPAQTFIAMSGTPVENRLSEYWSIMDFANRGYLGNLSHFVKEFAVPIQSHHDQHAVQRFRKVTAPFLLRRLKSDKSIISDLPDKIEQDQYCELSQEQVALYESVVRESLRVINGESDTFKRQGLVLQMILALKQICNHPAQYLKKGKDDAALSGKAALFLDLLETIHASHEKMLVFTQFREMGKLLSGWVEKRYGSAPLFLHGGVSRKKRDEMVEKFQNDRTERVFLLSLKAGGTGLNLTAASSVIHYDLWWNPAVEAQATDRAYRIGQQKNVQVHRFITRGTFEERINDMIRSKRQLADLTVGIGENWIGNLGNEELRNLFRLG